ncbi:MAG TPA: hypothetical protein GXZ21_02180 [Clostridiales bacterium]|nr:hypothetical protein [Clostridiales bacterium]
MKRIIILSIIIFTMSFLCSCNFRKEENVSENKNNMLQEENLKEDNEILNDLLYRDYGNGVELLTNTSIIITVPELNEAEGSFITINLFNNTDNILEMTIEYQGEPTISYSIKNKGVYNAYALIIDKKGDETIIDLTEHITVETHYSPQDSNYSPLDSNYID